MKCCKKCGAKITSERCQPCRASYLSVWRSKNVGYMRLYYQRHRTEAQLYGKQYYHGHRERINARGRQNHWLARLLHGDRLRAHEREYRRRHPDQLRVKNHRRRARSKASMGCFTEREWKALVTRQKGRCAECKRKCRLSADHIIPISAGGCSYIWNIQGLCHSCNSRKHTKFPNGAQFSLFDRPTPATS